MLADCTPLPSRNWFFCGIWSLFPPSPSGPHQQPPRGPPTFACSPIPRSLLPVLSSFFTETPHCWYQITSGYLRLCNRLPQTHWVKSARFCGSRFHGPGTQEGLTQAAVAHVSGGPWAGTLILLEIGLSCWHLMVPDSLAHVPRTAKGAPVITLAQPEKWHIFI